MLVSLLLVVGWQKYRRRRWHDAQLSAPLTLIVVGMEAHQVIIRFREDIFLKGDSVFDEGFKTDCASTASVQYQ